MSLTLDSSQTLRYDFAAAARSPFVLLHCSEAGGACALFGFSQNQILNPTSVDS